MKILLYGINYSPELTGIGKYSGEMGEWFGQHKADVKVITAPPYYPNWQIFNGYSAMAYRKEKHRGIDVIRCPLYVPSNPTPLTRLIHLTSFALSSFFALCTKLFWRPDVIIVVEPTAFCAPGALLLGVVTGSKTILHIQDYELDAMLGLGMMRNGLLARIAFGFERWIMRRFDKVSSISLSMLNFAKSKGVDEKSALFFPNWVDTNFITPEVDGTAYRSKMGFSSEQKLILYSGNIGRKQGLDLLIDAAKAFTQDKDVQFVVVGQGAYRLDLEVMATFYNLTNLSFHDLVPYEELPQLLAMADIHLVVQKKGAADAVMPSKLTSILSAGGHSLITAERGTELGLLVDTYPGIAERVEPEDLDQFVVGLKRLLDQDTTKYNKIARDYALTSLNKDAILDRFNDDLYDLCGYEVDGRSSEVESQES